MPTSRLGPVGDRAGDAGNQTVHAQLIDLSGIDKDAGVGDGVMVPGFAAVDGEAGPEGVEAGVLGGDFAGEGLVIGSGERNLDPLAGLGVELGDEGYLSLGRELAGGGNGQFHLFAGEGAGEFLAARGIGTAHVRGDGLGAVAGGEFGDGAALDGHGQ